MNTTTNSNSIQINSSCWYIVDCASARNHFAAIGRTCPRIFSQGREAIVDGYLDEVTPEGYFLVTSEFLPKGQCFVQTRIFRSEAEVNRFLGCCNDT
jgi:hypothetical protein